MKKFEIYLRISDTTRVCKFKKDTIEESRALVQEFKDKYANPDAETPVEVYYKIVEKNVVESYGEI